MASALSHSIYDAEDDDEFRRKAVTALVESDGDEAQDDSQEFTPEQLLEQLNAKDALSLEEFADYLDVRLGGLGAKKEDIARNVRHALRDGKSNDVFNLLAGAMSVVALSKDERAQLRQDTEDRLLEFGVGAEGEGKITVHQFNVADVAAAQADPTSFMAKYIKFVTEMRLCFATAAKIFLEGFDMSEDQAGFDRQMEAYMKACRNDMSAATNSYNRDWLGAVLANIGELHILRSMHDNMTRLGAQMQRTYG
jgi:hypothetical protein